jgi:hypothetical protein
MFQPAVGDVFLGNLPPLCPIKVPIVIAIGPQGNGKGFVPIAMYMGFVAVGVLIASELGYLPSASEKERTVSCRCQRPQEVHRRRLIRSRRVRCRLEG